MSRRAPVTVVDDSNAPSPNAPGANDDEVSLFRIGTTLLRHRWRIARWMLAGAVLALIPVLFQKLTYTASASFVPQGAPDPSRSGVVSLAGQLGIQMGGSGSLAQSPDFYVSLLRSRAILAPIAADTFAVPETGHSRAVPLLDLLDVPQTSPARRIELGIAPLSRAIDTKIDLKTGVVTVEVTTPWPTLSRAIASRLVDGVNTFNLRTRQSQASEERRFTEGRLAEARASLRAAEDRLQSFLQSNRQIQAPELQFDRDRLQRDVSLQQNIVTSLAQSYEEVRIREVRDTPVITVIEEPSLPTQPNPRGRVRRVLAGAIAGGFVAAFLAFTGDMIRRRRAINDPEAMTFLEMLAEIKAGFARMMPRRRSGARA